MPLESVGQWAATRHASSFASTYNILVTSRVDISWAISQFKVDFSVGQAMAAS